MLITPEGQEAGEAHKETLRLIWGALDRRGYKLQDICDAMVTEALNMGELVVSRWMAHGSWAGKAWEPLYLIAGGENDANLTTREQEQVEDLAGGYFGIVAWAAFVRDSLHTWEFYKDLQVKGQDLKCMTYFLHKKQGVT